MTSSEAAAQTEVLKYALSHGVKEGLERRTLAVALVEENEAKAAVWSEKTVRGDFRISIASSCSERLRD